MAIEAKAHAQSLFLMDNLHLIDPAMARDTPHSARDVRAVIEVNVVREVMHLDPLNRLSSHCTFSDREQLGALGVHERVAVHAGRGGRDGRVTRFIHSVVTVFAIDPHFTGVERVAVRDRLHRLVADISRLGRHAVPNQGCQIDGRTSEGETHDLPGFIGPAWEDEQLHRFRKPGEVLPP